MTTRRTFVKSTGLLALGGLIPFPASLLDSISEGKKAVSLAGGWMLRLDPENIGVKESWFNTTFKDPVKLPGSLQAQGYGNKVTADTEWWSGKIQGFWRVSPIYEKYRQPDNVKIIAWLQPENYFLGAAWYTREIEVPDKWTGQHIRFVMERVHWFSTLYVNGKEVGTQNSLAAPHDYDITNFCKPGKNILSIRIDNSRIINLGDNTHSVSDQTQSNWNGIVGDIALITHESVWIKNIQVYPNLAEKKARVKLSLGNSKMLVGNCKLELSAAAYNSGTPHKPGKLTDTFQLNGKDIVEYELDYPMGDDFQTWDEFNPALYKLEVIVRAPQGIKLEKEISFGMREIKQLGRQFILNGKPIHLRGNVDCAVFPEDGYPEMGLAWWKNIWEIHKEWGFNQVRFHSWCPPLAAFTAADEVGIYLQPEVGEWVIVDKPDQAEFLMKDSLLMLETYGNHASFLFMSLGNEARAEEKYMQEFLRAWKKDSRRLYSGKINGNPVIDEFQFWASRQSPKKSRLRYVSGWPPVPEASWYYEFPPSTTIEYSKAVLEYNKPIITHETGQRCIYPNVDHLAAKHNGNLKPAYLDIARDQLTERGMLDQVPDFIEASGKLQQVLYKEEFEANFRTEGLAGFQFLSLIDFPGQETAPTGVLDYFYGEKGTITPKEFRKFCHHTVLLCKMEKRTWFTNDQLQLGFSVFNFSGKDIQSGKLKLSLTDHKGKVLVSREEEINGAPHGKISTLTDFAHSLAGLENPAKYQIHAEIEDANQEKVVNEWDFWLYPAITPLADESDIIISDKFDTRIENLLKEGKTVLLLPKREQLKGQLGPCFTSFYWTAIREHGGESSAAGLMCDPAHPVFKHFPTESHGNWQWWELLTRASPMILDEFGTSDPWPKDYRPMLQLVPSWKLNLKYGVLSEAKMGKGKLMICSMDISTNLAKRKVAAQFRYSLLSYLKSAEFNPGTEVTPAMVAGVFANTTISNIAMLKATLTASSTAVGHPASNMIDGDKETFWLSDVTSNSLPALEIATTELVSVKGIRYTGSKLRTGRVQKLKIFNISSEGSKSLLLEKDLPDDNQTRDLLFDKNYELTKIRIEIHGLYAKDKAVNIPEIDLVLSDNLPFEG